METGTQAHVALITVGRVREVDWNGRTVRTGIWKAPADGPVRVAEFGAEHDEQGDPDAHGGLDKALYAYGSRDLAWWSRQLGRELEPGVFGHNLTIAGMDVSRTVIGERWRAGGIGVEVSAPRIPCFKLGMRMGDPGFPRRFAAADRPGAYLRVLEPGVVEAGDPVEVLERPAHGVTVADASRIYHRDRHEAGRLLEVPALSGALADWAAGRAQPSR
jgi:MOSC domain-containing protein YiiM